MISAPTKGALFFSMEGKMKKQCFLKSISLAALISFNLHAQSIALTEFKQYFKNGQYTKAITALENLDPNENALGEKSYLLGLSYSKLQEFDKAINHFEAAIKAKNQNADLYYEYGQALYAANELKAARKAFNQSANQKFNVPASLYYVAHISQILEEFTEARDNYVALIKNKDTDQKIKQIARFQLAETLLLIMREKVKIKEDLEKGVDKYILTMMKQAVNTDKGTPLAQEINLRIQELQKEFELDPDLLANGKRISPKRYSGYFTQKIKFDDNISLTNEENNVQQSKKESYIFETEVFAKYDFVVKKRFIISPDVRISFVEHSDQDSAEVFQNNSFALNADLKNKYEHTINAQPATFLFDIEFSKNYKDWKREHKRTAYSNSLAFGVGEIFNYFSVGETSFKFKRKAFSGENEAISNNTTSISADQIVSFSNQHLLITFFEASFVDNFNNTDSNTDSYLLRLDYLIPEIMPKYTLGLAMATTITDTKTQMATRGTEVSLNPSIDLSKEINEKMNISVNYDYSKNKSKQSDYSYQKNVFKTEFRYSF